jgi:hypothetical protein
MKAPVSRPAYVSDYLLQAKAFASLFSRLDPSADPDATFVLWANSKDFSPRDRLAIQRQVREILARRSR